MAKDFRDNPYAGEPAVSDLEEKVLGLLEDGGIDTATNDQIVALINAAEKRLAAGEPAPRMMVFCGRCNESEPVENSCARQHGYI
jgi:hypothetical protein